MFDKMLGYANHLGLYAEQTGARGEALGNFPQAFTHLSLISARCVNACGKFPSASPLGPVCSA